MEETETGGGSGPDPAEISCRGDYFIAASFLVLVWSGFGLILFSGCDFFRSLFYSSPPTIFIPRPRPFF